MGCAPFSGGRKRRVVLEDPAASAPAGRPKRPEAELVHERLPRGAVGGERVGLATSAVERTHELATQALAQRVLGDWQLLQLRHEVAVSPAAQVGLDPAPPPRPAEARPARPTSSSANGSGARSVQRRPTPERERLGQACRRAGGISLVECPAARGHEKLEAAEIDGRRQGRRKGAYPGGRVTSCTPSGPSALRRAQTSPYSATGAVGGGCSPQSASSARSVETTSFGLSASSASRRAQLLARQRERLAVEARLNRPEQEDLEVAKPRRWRRRHVV